MRAALRISSLLLFALPWAPLAAACLLGDSYDTVSSPAQFELLEEADEVRELVENEEQSEDGIAAFEYISLSGVDGNLVDRFFAERFCSEQAKQNPTRGPPSFIASA